MKSYILKPSEKKKLGDKTEQYYLAEYSEAETQELEQELEGFLREHIKNSAGQSRLNRVDVGSVKENLNLVASTCRADILGLFQMVDCKTTKSNRA